MGLTKLPTPQIYMYMCMSASLLNVKLCEAPALQIISENELTTAEPHTAPTPWDLPPPILTEIRKGRLM